jgi:hypothetical protein
MTAWKSHRSAGDRPAELSGPRPPLGPRPGVPDDGMSESRPRARLRSPSPKPKEKAP